MKANLTGKSPAVVSFGPVIVSFGPGSEDREHRSFRRRGTVLDMTNGKVALKDAMLKNRGERRS